MKSHMMNIHSDIYFDDNYDEDKFIIVNNIV